MKKALVIASVASMIDQFNMQNIRLLKELGYSVCVACNFKKGSTCDAARIAALKENLRALSVEIRQIDFSRGITDIRQNSKAYRQVKTLLSEQAFSMIHCHSPIGGLLTRLAAGTSRKHGTKVIYTAHGFHFYHGAPLKNWLLYYPVEWGMSWVTDELITINREDFALAKKRFHAKHVTYIPGVGVDTERFCPAADPEGEKHRLRAELGIPEQRFVLLSVGELQDRKNHMLVIKALAGMQDPNLLYLIAGIGERKDSYQEFIEQNGLTENVRLLGYRTDIDVLCRLADCFIHPSVREGLGIAPLEAMASGLPLISSKVNGILDYTKDGVTGCCVDPYSVEEMTAAIKKMAADRAFRERCGVNNVAAAKEFDSKRSLQITKKVYIRLGGKL